MNISSIVSVAMLVIAFVSSISAQQRVEVWVHPTEPPDYLGASTIP